MYAITGEWQRNIDFGDIDWDDSGMQRSYNNCHTRLT